MTENKPRQLHAVVHGRVQGVGFRDFTQRRAAELGVTGWVRNQPDSTVEVTAEADRETLERFLAFLWRGPNAARVLRVEYDYHEATGRFTGFSVR
jgi:acylphosphatase